MAPAVLWFDEIEMGITSTETSGEQGRIFAFFLTWMQEKTPRPVRGRHRQPHRPAARRNDPQGPLRRSVLRRPAARNDERIEIFKIHLDRRGVDPARFNLAQLTEFTIGWTGAEIEQCVVSAMTKARLADREVDR